MSITFTPAEVRELVAVMDGVLDDEALAERFLGPPSGPAQNVGGGRVVKAQGERRAAFHMLRTRFAFAVDSEFQADVRSVVARAARREPQASTSRVGRTRIDWFGEGGDGDD